MLMKHSLSLFLIGFFSFTISAQNIGIGTAGPSEKLDVVGNIKSSGEAYWGNAGTRTVTRNDAGAYGVDVRSGFYETSSPLNFPSGAASWWHLIDVRHSNTSNNYAMQIAGSFYDQNLWYRKTAAVGSRAWSKIISSNDLNGTENYLAKFTGANSIGNSQLFDNGTNVGIGTSSPTEKLEITGGSYPAILLSNNSSGRDLYIAGGSQSSLGTSEAVIGVTNGNLHIDSRTSNQIYFQHYAAQDVIFNVNGGEVGIGTASPAQKLHVVGTGRFSSLSSGGNGAFVRTNTAGDLAITNFTGNTNQVLRGDGSFGSVPRDYTYSLPNTGGTAQWVKLGTLTIPQQGNSAFIKVVSNSGYNASVNQNFEVHIRFKTSNTSSLDGNGFAADASYYTTGRYAQFATDGRIKFKANAAGGSASSYELFMYFSTYTGSNSFYSVETTGGSWSHSGAVGQADPGVASSTVLIPTQEFNVRGSSLVVNSSGYVGIGTNNPTYHLHVNGRIRSNGINETSDIRYKNEINTLTNSLDKIIQLRGVSYYWNRDDFPDKDFSSDLEIGLIAQEVEKVFPELVDKDIDGYKSVQYSHLIPVLIEALKEVNTKLSEKNARIDILESRLNKQDELIKKILDAKSPQSLSVQK